MRRLCRWPLLAGRVVVHEAMTLTMLWYIRKRPCWRPRGTLMYLVMAYGLGIFTVLMVLALLWLGWERRRDEQRGIKYPY